VHRTQVLVRLGWRGQLLERNLTSHGRTSVLAPTGGARGAVVARLKSTIYRHSWSTTWDL